MTLKDKENLMYVTNIGFLGIFEFSLNIPENKYTIRFLNGLVLKIKGDLTVLFQDMPKDDSIPEEFIE